MPPIPLNCSELIEVWSVIAWSQLEVFLPPVANVPEHIYNICCVSRKLVSCIQATLKVATFDESRNKKESRQVLPPSMKVLFSMCPCEKESSLINENLSEKPPKPPLAGDIPGLT